MSVQLKIIIIHKSGGFIKHISQDQVKLKFR